MFTSLNLNNAPKSCLLNNSQQGSFIIYVTSNFKKSNEYLNNSSLTFINDLLSYNFIFIAHQDLFSFMFYIK